MSHLAGGVLVFLRHIREHPSKKGHVHRFAAVERFLKSSLQFRRCTLGCFFFRFSTLLVLILSFTLFYAFPLVMNDPGDSLNFPLTQK